MTQHYIKTTHINEPVEVLIGWDRPLQRFFLVVERTNIDIDDENFEDGDEYVYSNLLDKNLPDGSIHYQDLGYFRRILEVLNISIPNQVFEEIKNEAFLNLGNKKVFWNIDGTKKQE